MTRPVLNNWVRVKKDSEVRMDCNQTQAQCLLTRLGTVPSQFTHAVKHEHGVTDALRPHCGKVSYHGLTVPWICTICFNSSREIGAYL